MKHLLLILLTGCSGETFIGFEAGTGTEAGNETGDSAASEASSEVDSSADAADAGSSADAAVEADTCGATGLKACDDAVALFCQRMKACCVNNSCCSGDPNCWQNKGGTDCTMHFYNFQCPGRTTCEKPCLADIQAASCMTITSKTTPAYVSNNCMPLWP
jgi:hypothetical protein